jgi:hypothetical protein
MSRPYKQMKKNKNGSITIHGTIPPVLAEDAIRLFEMGYTPVDWLRTGIREMKRTEGLM